MSNKPGDKVMAEAARLLTLTQTELAIELEQMIVDVGARLAEIAPAKRARR